MKQVHLMVAAWLLLTGALAGQDFTNVAPAMGITHGFGTTGFMAGGVSFRDFNLDGWDDLVFCSEAGEPLMFYVNNGGTFTSISPLVDVTGETKEFNWVDYDNDGDQDIFVTVANEPNRLFRNDGGLQFTDVSTVAFGAQGNQVTQGAVWGDLNKDGWLDLFETNFYYETGLTCQLWMNNGDGTFTDLGASPFPNMGVLPTFDAFFFDYNMDGWPDMYTSNDKEYNPNALYRNDAGQGFTDVSVESGTDVELNSMTAGGADYNNDGFLDLYATTTEEGNALLRNNGDGTFTDVSVESGTSAFRVGWAANFFDCNNNGLKDLFVSTMSFPTNPQPNALFMNQGDGTFTEPLYATGGPGGDDFGVSLCNVVGDINNDGKIDVVVGQFMNSQHMILRNDEVGESNWIKINLLGVVSNSEGIGSVIEIWADGQYQMQYTHNSIGYLGQNSQNYHFGLGSSTQIDSIKVTWPSGTIDNLTNVTNVKAVEYIIEGQAALPVELVDFKVSPVNGTALLSWETATEQNTDYFSIERSTDGRSFDEKGRVNATGNSTISRNYTYEDLLPQEGETVYYRLKMIDNDGSFEYSPIRTLRLSSSAGSVKDIFSVVELPENPMYSGDLRIGLTSEVAMPLQMTLVSRVGQELRTLDATLTEGMNRLSLDASALPSGSYFLRLEAGGLTKSFQIMIARR